MRLFYSCQQWCIYLYSNTFIWTPNCPHIFLFLPLLKCMLPRVHNMHLPPIIRESMVFLLLTKYGVSIYVLTHIISTLNYHCFILFLFSLLSVCSLKFTKCCHSRYRVCLQIINLNSDIWWHTTVPSDVGYG
jgi:hypothetical protein